MADWYCNFGNGTSTGYYAVAQFANATNYSIGNIIRQLATPAVGSERCFRCTTAGLTVTEQSWNLTKAATTTAGTAVFTECTGNATQNWSAPHARIATACGSGWAAAGDRVFVGDNHAETQASAMSIPAASNSTQALPIDTFCVSVSGSIPPVSADLRTSATCAATGANQLGILSAVGGIHYFYGIEFIGGTNMRLASGGTTISQLRFDNCKLTVSAGTFLLVGAGSVTQAAIVRLNNTPVNFGVSGLSIYNQGAELDWKNTASALPGTVPTILLNSSSGTASAGCGSVTTLDGVDISALNTTLSGSGGGAGADGNYTVNVINCTLNASVAVSVTPLRRGERTNLIVSDSSGTTYRQERHDYDGDLTTETTFTRVGGATDPAGNLISWKIVSTANTGPVFPFASFPVAKWNATTGSTVTATIEIESATTLKNTDVWAVFEYLSSSGAPIASAVSNGAADLLATGSNLPTSSATWNGSLGSAVKQYLQVTFTPQLAGLVRATVYVAKPSQTLYIDPVITLT